MAPPGSRDLSIPGLPTRGNRRRRIAGGELSPSHKKPITRVQSWPEDADKPAATARGVSCRIQLAEPHVYLFGLKPTNREIAAQEFAPAIIRGKLILKVEKTLPPDRVKYHEEIQMDNYQVLPFFNALLPPEDDGYGAQCTYTINDQVPTTSSLRIDSVLADALNKVVGKDQKKALTASEQKRLSGSAVRSNSFGTAQASGASGRRMASAPQTGYKIFPPGVYEYSFAIALDHKLPETMNLPYGNVHWKLESLVERQGPLRQNLRGNQEVLVVRAPQAQAEDQLLEPFEFTQTYKELACHVLVQGHAFPIGGKMSVQLTFTPIEKVEMRAVSISIIEEPVYSARGGAVINEGDTREVRLFEKRAGQPVSEEYGGVVWKFKEGGDNPELRAQARDQAESLRGQTATATGVDPEPLPEAVDNILGPIDLGLDHFIGQTRMFYLRFTRLKPDESGVPKKVEETVNFAVAITLLSCLAANDRTTLPMYRNDSNPEAPSRTAECGCPNAGSINTSSLVAASRNDLMTGFSHISGEVALTETGENMPPRVRPIQMLRYPSYAPPAFDADQPPPPINSPPPSYNNVVGTPSYDGLGDYFTRMANEDQGEGERQDEGQDGDESQGESEDESDGEGAVISEGDSGNESKIRQNTNRTGRVYIPNPRSPGLRAPSTSMEINRDRMFQQGLYAAMQERQAESETMSQLGGTEPGDNTSRA
ncbi:hypothetical protein V492_03052 [Pseudogymnoascus sp. VKM F-4246]|nr:hypothetical protein V492_03052 [Pseudogymnoascus sp. VKM F-4246]